jgi:high-affinity nickel-transport protein
MKAAFASMAAQPWNLKSKIAAIFAVLVGANIAVWVWALASFHAFPILLGTAFLTCSFGRRHAVDADHIAAVDNLTRKLMQQGQRPAGVGLYFSLDH